MIEITTCLVEEMDCRKELNKFKTVEQLDKLEFDEVNICFLPNLEIKENRLFCSYMV